MTLAERAHATRTREDFVEFLVELRADFTCGNSGWLNADLPTFLDAMAAWAHDMEGYYRNTGQNPSELTPWRIMADVLMAARNYE
jgi:hypothetical protein